MRSNHPVQCTNIIFIRFKFNNPTRTFKFICQFRCLSACTDTTIHMIEITPLFNQDEKKSSTMIIPLDTFHILKKVIY